MADEANQAGRIPDTEWPRWCPNNHQVPTGQDRCPECGERYDRARLLAELDARNDAEWEQVSAEFTGPVGRWVRWSDTAGLPLPTRLLMFGFAKLLRNPPAERYAHLFPDPVPRYGDWCRFRDDDHCWVPAGGEFDPLTSNPPQDRGRCSNLWWEDQKSCPVSEPGPNSGEPDAGFGKGRPRGPGTPPLLPDHITPPWAPQRHALPQAPVNRSGSAQAESGTGYLQGRWQARRARERNRRRDS